MDTNSQEVSEKIILKSHTWCGDNDLAACKDGQEKIIVDMDCKQRTLFKCLFQKIVCVFQVGHDKATFVLDLFNTGYKRWCSK